MRNKLILFLVILASVLTFVCFAQDADTAVPPVEVVQIKVNGAELVSPYAAVLTEDTTIVPLRPVMEMLDCKVGWDDATQTVNIIKDETEIKITIGSEEMNVNGEIRQIPCAAELIGEVTYVPIRAVSEALGATVGWEAADTSAGISTLGTYGTLTIGDYLVTVGTTVNELRAVCGEPSYTTIGENGLLWYVYSTYPTAFMAVATDAGIVCGYYTNSPLFSTSDGAVYGSKLPEGVGEYREIYGDGYTLSEYYDTQEGILYGIHYMLNGFYTNHDINEGLAGQARIGLDILNSFRYANGLPVMQWDEAAAACSTDHSKYMAQLGELTHSGADGSSAIKRYLTYNPTFTWRSWGENICAGADNIYLCMNGWINSAYHRAIMLTDKQYTGIGLIYNPYGVYNYTATMFLLK